LSFHAKTRNFFHDNDGKNYDDDDYDDDDDFLMMIIIRMRIMMRTK